MTPKEKRRAAKVAKKVDRMQKKIDKLNVRINRMIGKKVKLEKKRDGIK